GAMTATTIAAMAGAPVRVPPALRGGMIMVLGIMLGSSFAPAILDHLGEWSVSLAGLAVYIVAATVIGILFLRRVARYDPVTAYFTATPGGFNEMVLAGGAMGGDDRTIALVHAQRVMLVVLTIPFWFQLLSGYHPGDRGPLGPSLFSLSPPDVALLAACAIGAPIAQRLHVPAAFLLGPMVLSAAIHLAGLTEGRPPGVLVAVAQVVVGASIGARFTGVPWHRIARTAVVAAGLTALVLGVTVLAALALHALTGIGIPALILAYAPGGLAEMSLIALALHVDVAFVATHHAVRILLIILLAPLAFRLWRRLGSGLSG
ncbi:MAG TPA: AbrB family transcriptional regulator, partial [Azospirillaceae bacterium]|nr:AbrB family transcriptional regulator [Azospirillaceae bacterium]